NRLAMGVQPDNTPTAQQAASTPTYPAVWSLLANELLDVLYFTRQGRAQNSRAGFGHHDSILNPDADVLFGNIDARFDGDDHAGCERRGRIAGIVNVQSYVVPQPVDEIFAQRLAVQVVAVAVDVVVSDL